MEHALMNTRESRIDPRIPTQVPVIVCTANGRRFRTRSRNLSAHGLMFDLPRHVRFRPELGSLLLVRYQAASYPTPDMSAQVVRVEEDGIAVSLASQNPDWQTVALFEERD